MTAGATLKRVPPEARPEAGLALAAEGKADLDDLRSLAAGCRGCDLWQRATQTVFGEGPVPARLMLVGEQPGDQEDIKGQPFVGPAGRILDQALDEAGIDRETVFVTNVVKHFKWRPAPKGKRRLHETPTRAEVGACLPWVESELALVRPEALVLMGATAARTLVGPKVSVTRDHGVLLHSTLAPLVVATIHPSAVLRARAGTRDELLKGFIEDLESVIGRLAS
jgi:uracil-DNA glycosylase family protein